MLKSSCESKLFRPSLVWPLHLANPLIGRAVVVAKVFLKMRSMSFGMHNGTLMGQRSHGAARGLSTSLRDGSGASGRGAGTRNGYCCCLERIGPGGAMPVITSGELKTRHRQVRDDQPEGLRVRIHRAISWLARAQREAGDPDATFIFLCIALNAAYAHEFGFEERELVQRDLPSHPHLACLISRT